MNSKLRSCRLGTPKKKIGVDFIKIDRQNIKYSLNELKNQLNQLNQLIIQEENDNSSK